MLDLFIFVFLIWRADTSVFYVHPFGSDTGPASFDEPLATIQTCVNKLSSPGDSCLLKSGNYTEETVIVSGKHGTSHAPMVISAAGDGPVYIDGTKIVQGSWKSTGQGKIYSTNLPNGKAWQLFVDGDMMVPARWPNARWNDKSMFEGPEHWAHSGPLGTGTHNPKSGVGTLHDIGACNNTNDCCSSCNNNSLAASGIDATGAIAILNLWADGTGIEKIAKHKKGTSTLHYKATWCAEEIIRRGKCGDGYRGGRGRYYLEGKKDFLDSPGEWWFDSQTNDLYVWMPDSTDPSEHTVHTKTQTYAFNIKNSSFITFGNMTFFGTTLLANDNDTGLIFPLVHNLRFESLNFLYPSSSRRMLGSLEPIDCMAVWTTVNMKTSSNSKTDAWVNHADAWVNHTFIDVSWRYADGMALQVRGSGIQYENCEWIYNSWTALGSITPGKWDNGGVLVTSGLPRFGPSQPMFRRLTFRGNGASKALRPPHESGIVIELINFMEQMSLADDGCMVETGSSNSAHMRYIWAHDSGKSALRFDGTDASGTAYGMMANTVAWNISGLVVKGDHHIVANNTVFDASDISASQAAHSLPRYQDEWSPLDNFTENMESIHVENPGQTTDKANTHTLFYANLFDRVEHWKDCNDTTVCPFAGKWMKSNLIGNSDGSPNSTDTPILVKFDIRQQLRDPWNYDFRPCPNSLAASRGAGAYDVYNVDDEIYWIPGAKGTLPSQPIPRDGATRAKLDTNLIFLCTFRATSHVVYFGKTVQKLVQVATLNGEQNIASGDGKKWLQPNTHYSWRVDARFGDGSVRTGRTWTFITSDVQSCPPPPPTPPTPAPTPVPKACEAAMEKCCGDVKSQGTKCGNHIARHNATLIAPPANCTRLDEQLFCGGFREM